MSNFQPSPEQQAIFDYVLQNHTKPGRKALAIRALAGTGKTTTLVELVRQLGRAASGIYCAFNRDIVSEVEPKFKGTGIIPKTFHSLGNGALRKAVPGAGSPDGNKYRKLAEDWFNDHDELRSYIVEVMKDIEDDDERYKTQKMLEKDTRDLMQKVCDWLRVKLIAWDDVEALAHLINYNHLADDVIYDRIIDMVLAGVPGVMAQAEKDLKEKGKLDFTDMIYWCVRWKLNLPKYNWVLADEMQDINPMQREMIQMSLAENSFLIAVGDEKQAIYAFGGADSDSFDLTVKAFHCHVLPLTVTRRCSRIITQHAQALVPAFTAPENVRRGKIVWLDDTLLTKYAEAGDLVVSRVKAPLVAAYLDLLAIGKTATILGSDIGKSLAKLMQKIQDRKGFAWADFELHLDAFRDHEKAKFLKRHDEAGAEAIADQCEALRVVYERVQPTSAEQLIHEIERLFSEGGRNAIKLCTAHKSKGLEADRVFLLRPGKFPLFFPKMTPEQMAQESNLEYVAISRAKHTLVYLTDKDYIKNHAMPLYAQNGTFDDLEWKDEQPLTPVKEVEAPVVATVIALPAPAPTEVSPAGEKLDMAETPVLPDKTTVFPPNPFARPSLVADLKKTGQQLIGFLDGDDTPDDDATQNDDTTQEAPAPVPVPFKASGNLTKDMLQARQNASDRIFATLNKLTLQQALTLRELLDDVIQELEVAS